jgi:thymidylate synthase
MVPNELIGSIGDAHIYLNQIDGVKEQLTREPMVLPKLHINSEFWLTGSGECGIGNFTSNIDSLIQSFQITDFEIIDYQSHPAIKFPLSN